jgi:iron complex outermembrane receptor protein
MHHFLPKYLFTFSLIGIAGTAAAQTVDSVVADNLQNLQPIEVRSLRVSGNAPFVRTELKRIDIEQQNTGQDLPYLLQYTPSAVVTSDAGAGVGYSGLRIRGTDGTRINVTLNGVAVNDAESQATFFVNLPDLASSTSSIQVQRGVGTSTNGAASFGATISVSNLELMKEAGGEASIGYGSFNTQKYTVRAGTGFSKNGFAMDVRLSKISSDGYMQRSASDLRALQLLAAWVPNDKTSFRFMAMMGQEKTGQAWGGVIQDSLATNRRFNELGVKADGSYHDNQTDNYRQNYYQLFADHKLNKNLTAHLGIFLTRGAGYYEEYRLDQRFSSYGLDPFITPSGDTFTRTDLIRQRGLDNYHYGTVFSLLYEKAATRLAFGGGWSQYTGKHIGEVTWAAYGIPYNHRFYNVDAQKNDLNIYAKAQHDFTEKLIGFADLQWRNVAYTMNGFRENPTLRPAVAYNFFNPKAGLTYLLRNTAADRQKLYASFAVANHEPNREDFETSPDALPKPERLYDAEAGYEINRKNWNIAANLYYMHYDNQLVLTGKINDVGAYTRSNVASSYRAGIELQGGVSPLSWLSVLGNVTYSQNKIQNFSEFVDNYDDGSQEITNYGTTDISFSPSLIGAGTLRFQPFATGIVAKGLYIHLTGKYVGRQYLDNTSEKSRSIADYTLCDLRINYNITLRPFRELGFIVAVNNAFNRMYENNGYTFSYIADQQRVATNYFFPQAGTNLLLGVTMKW